MAARALPSSPGLYVLRRHLSAFATLPADVRWYIVAEGLAAFATGAFGAVYNLYVLALGFDTAFLGTLLVAGMVGAGASVLPAGALVDRIGPRALLLGGSVVAASGVGVQLVAPSGVVLLAGNVVAGAGGAAFYAAAAPYLAQAAPAERQNDVFSLDTAAALVGAAAGSVVAGQVAALLVGGAHAAVGDTSLGAYRAALVVGGAVGAASFLALTRTRDVPAPRPRTGASTDRPAGPPWRAVLANPGARALAMTTALIGLGAGLFLPFLNVYFVQVLGASPAVYGWVSGAGTLTRLGATLVAPAAAGRHGRVAVIAGSQLASVPFLLLLGAAPHLALAALAVLVRGALMNMAAPLQAGFTMGILRPELRGTGNALLLLVANGSRAVSTLAGGTLITHIGYRWPYVITAALYVTSAALFWWWFRAGAEAEEGGTKAGTRPER